MTGLETGLATGVMPRTAALWLQLGLWTAVALGLGLALSPETPSPRVPPLLAGVVGIAAGLLLYVAVARRRPFAPGLLPGILVQCGVLAVAAASEEVVWRRLVLGELLRSGQAAALAGSTLAFALAHRTRPGLHLGTGAVFGGLYLATGALAAAVAAHWTYNVCLLVLAERQAGDPP